jgi:hypothetical protein
MGGNEGGVIPREIRNWKGAIHMDGQDEQDGEATDGQDKHRLGKGRGKNCGLDLKLGMV